MYLVEVIMIEQIIFDVPIFGIGLVVVTEHWKMPLVCSRDPVHQQVDQGSSSLPSS